MSRSITLAVSRKCLTRSSESENHLVLDERNASDPLFRNLGPVGAELAREARQL